MNPQNIYDYNEYLLVLNPHEDLCNKIFEIKKEFSRNYKALTAIYSKPHVTLVNFLQFEMREERLVNHLNNVAASYHPFKIDLKDYGSFPTHSIFINVASKQQVKNLIKELKPAQHLMTLDKENKPHFIDNPYLTISRGLLPWQYEKSWLEFSHRHFTGRFVANNMLLMKRKKGEKYQLVKKFDFLDLPPKAQQPELFS
jgi:2'-5' RNA ligase